MGAESRISEVTLYARGARVRRVVTVALDGRALRIPGLPASLLDDTVRVEATGGVVTALRVGLAAPPPAAAADEEPAELRAARRRSALADAEVERLDAALAQLAAAPIAVAPATKRDEPAPAWAAVVAARHGLVQLRTARELALRDQAAAARRAAEEARRALAAEVDRDRRAGSARPPRRHELRKHLDLEVAGAGPATLTLEYQVAAARWAPSYVARLDGDAVRVELRAVVAQDTGEDWTGVALRLSTAEPERLDPLPELAAQRIGRRQAEPARPGYRAPPIGAGELYLDYLRAFADGFDDEPTDDRAAGLDAQRWDDEAAKDAFEASESTAVMAPPPPGAYGGPTAGYAPPRAAAAMADAGPAMAKTFAHTLPMPVMAAPARSKSGLLGGLASTIASGFGGGGADDDQVQTRRTRRTTPEAISVAAPPPRLDYANLRMAPASSRQRGRLVPAPGDPRLVVLDGELAEASERLDRLALPAGCSAAWPHTYDYAFASDGAVDVAADGAWHSIAVAARPTTARLRHVAVPREQPDAFRIAEVVNPFDGPLLPGPIDVYDRGTFLVTSAVEQTAPGATVELGLGVDPTVKLARNTEFAEEATGVLRGGLRLHHAIAIDIKNLGDRALDLEVRERVPVTREGDDDVEVVVGKVEPAWERWTPDPEAPRERRLRGGHRWRITVPAGGTRTLRAAYDVKIANKHELVGGNRREP
jgi:hypothetical protein